MSAQKNTPDRGPITIVKNLTAAEIQSSLDAGFDWVSEPVYIDVPSGAGSNATIGANFDLFVGEITKRHFPMDGDTTGCTMTGQLEGRRTPNGEWQSIKTFTISSFGATSLTAGDETAQRSSFIFNDGARRLWVRLRVTAFSDSGDAQGASGTPGFNYIEDANTTSELIPAFPAAYTSGSGDDEGFKLLLPPHSPVQAAKPENGNKYPVLIHIRHQASSEYIGSTTYPDPITSSTGITGLIAYRALRRGWAVLCLTTVGNNSDLDSGGGRTDGYWKEDPDLGGTNATNIDARVNMKWAVQWVRAYGKDLYDLDPDRVFLWGDYAAGSNALLTAYDGLDEVDANSSDRLLRYSGIPNLVGARNPEVDWTVMDPSLVGPLEDGSSAGQSAASIGTATGAANFSLARIINNKGLTAEKIARISRTPFFVTGDQANTGVVNGGTFAYTDGVASWYVPTYPAPGDDDVDVQYSSAHLYLWAQAVDAFRKKQKGACPFVLDSVINSEVALSTVVSNQGLIDTNESDATTTNDNALQWAESHFGIGTRIIEPQATFDSYIIP